MHVVRTLVVVLVFVLGSCGAAIAEDSPFYFDESGSMQQREYWSPDNRSLDHEYDRLKQNQYQNQQTQRQNEALMDEYVERSRRNAMEPPRSSSEQFLVYLDGRLDNPKLCTRTAVAVYCN